MADLGGGVAHDAYRMQLSRAIFTEPKAWLPATTKEATFTWFVRPPGGTAKCTFYNTDPGGMGLASAQLGWGGL